MEMVSRKRNSTQKFTGKGRSMIIGREVSKRETHLPVVDKDRVSHSRGLTADVLIDVL